MLTDDEIQKQIKFLREEKVYNDEGKGAWGILEEAADTIERLAVQIKVKEEAATNLAERLLARVRTLESALAQYPNEEHAAVLEAGK
jgi:primosomal protein N''